MAEVFESYAYTDTVSSHFNEVVDIVEAGQVIAQLGHSGMPGDYKSVLHFGVSAGWPPTEGTDMPVEFLIAGMGLCEVITKPCHRWLGFSK